MRIKLRRLGSITNSFRQITRQWRIFNPAARTAITTVGVFGAVLTAFTLVNTINALNATAASVLVAVTFGVATIFQQRQSQRREHTVSLLTELISAGHVGAGIGWVADRQMNNEPITEKISAEERRHVRVALNYYELVSALALRGQVDVRVVRDIAGSSMTRNFDICRPYIDYRRGSTAPLLYTETELFLAEYCRPRSAN